ncbi:MAG: oxaloacetate decarboxylase alpha subunit [Gammaproteobacteria bacterium]|jgi:oxaloacetate decarboxylase alpha subunit
MGTIKIVDTTLRDGHQCLWATRMSTPMMEPIIERIDRIGFEAIELMGAVHFDACVRYLKEDPWQRVRLFRARTSTPLQALLRSRCALSFELQPEDLNRLWIERLIANGIDRFVAFDGLHDLDNLADGLLHAKRLGAMTTGWLIFSESPVHTDALYAAKAQEFIARAKVDMLMIEDTSGILTPERAATLVPAIKAVIGERRLGLHTHNLVGLGQRTYLQAVRSGVDQLYTCIAPIADGNAPPSITTTMRNLRYQGYELDLDDNLIEQVSAHFTRMARVHGKPVGRPADFDAANFGHQIPGGVLSNLVSQLQAAGLGDRVGAVLAECAQVREDLGWPIMVTPFSQLVGVQATLNVIEGQRYVRVVDEVKKYVLGYYGRLLAPVAADALDRIMSNGSATIGERPAVQQPVVDALRQQFPGVDADELLLRSAFPAHLLNDHKPEPTATPSIDLGGLVRSLASFDHLDEVRIRSGGINLTMRW